MNSQEIHEKWRDHDQRFHRASDLADYAAFGSCAQAFWLCEIAYQLAVLNERKHKQDEDKRSSRQIAGHRENRSVVRKTSTAMYFRPSSWNIEVPLDDLRQFMPNPDQPELQDLEINQVSIGTLGTKSDVEVKRVR